MCFLYPICSLQHAKSLWGNSGFLQECHLPIRQVSALDSNRSFVNSWSPTIADMPGPLGCGQEGGPQQVEPLHMGTTVLLLGDAWGLGCPRMTLITGRSPHLCFVSTVGNHRTVVMMSLTLKAKQPGWWLSNPSEK